MSNSTLVKEQTQSRPWLSAWVPVAIWLLIIAFESTPLMGADHTSGPLRWLMEIFHGPFTTRQWWYWHLVVRKTGQVVGYGILSVLMFRAVWMTFRINAGVVLRELMTHFLAIAGTFLVASLDEFHQTFLPNRTGLFSDVLIDTGGALVGQTLILIWFWTRRPQD